MKILGIDPGMKGALAVIGEGLHGGTIFDMPTFTITKGKSARQRINITGLLDIIQAIEPDHAVIEQVSAQPMNGAASAFTYGFGAGVIEACLVALAVPFTYVPPQTWKKSLKCPKDKDGARMRATQLLPALAGYWPLKGNDGRAEAALIALWGSQNLK